MSYLVGEDRYQSSLIPRSLDEMMDENNPVRVIDAFVDRVDLKTVGFKAYEENKRGQRPYQREDLLIVIYSYMSKTRFSRSIEQECKRNIELMWLTGGITPDHGTISGFIKENKDGHLLKRYKCRDYENCINKSRCTTSKTGRSINRPVAYDELAQIEVNTFQKSDVYKMKKPNS
ncbi:MAG: transposase [Clostridiales bacterium]|nr:transposase [Clostridiales bacterium]